MAEAHNIEPQELTEREREHLKWLADYDYTKDGEPTYRWPFGSIEFEVYKSAFSAVVSNNGHRA